MKTVIIIQQIHPEGINLLKDNNIRVVFASGVDNKTLLKETQDCDGIIIRTTQLSGEVIKNAKKLRVVAKHGKGVDNIDIKAATEEGVLILNAPYSNVNSVAEHTVTMMLALLKNLIIMNNEVRKGRFNSRDKFFSNEIGDKVVGIIGLGDIGRRVAEILTGFNVKILGYDPYIEGGKNIDNINLVYSLNDILNNSDIVSLHVPLNKNTYHMIGRNQLNIMKKDSFLINVARGEVVDENALYEVLSRGGIRGAALDVFEKEPPDKDNPLFKLNNVVLTPHYAALTREALIDMAIQTAQGMIDCFRGERPKYIVNDEVFKQI